PVLGELTVVVEHLRLEARRSVQTAAAHPSEIDRRLDAAAVVRAVEIVPDDLGAGLWIGGVDLREGEADDRLGLLAAGLIDDTVVGIEHEMIGVAATPLLELLVVADLAVRPFDDGALPFAFLVELEDLRRQ